MEDIITYMIEEQWGDDLKGDRKRFLLKLAKESAENSDIASKIGSMLIFNQLLEEYLKDIVEYSAYYIKAEIWPADVDLSFDFSKANFGDLIRSFKRFAMKEYNRDVILNDLTKYNKKRNEVVHHLFGIEDLSALAAELDEYAEIAEELFYLLLEYDNCICEKFCDLSTRVDFREFLEFGNKKKEDGNG